MTLEDDKKSIENLVGSSLDSISELLALIVSAEKEQDLFLEIGCFFYRVSLAIMEFQKNEKIPENAEEMLQKLLKCIIIAKDIVENFQKDMIHPVSNPEPISRISKLEDVIKQMGEYLGLAPCSTLGDEEYVKIAVQSLATEMQNIHFEIEETRVSPTETIETDLYPVDIEISTDNQEESISSRRKSRKIDRFTKSGPQIARYVEPLYETFFCPLTKEIMDDPVTIESGVTYEKQAILDWFEDSKLIFCPITKQKLESKSFSPNKAIKSTINQWKERNEVAMIKVARAALSVASSEYMVIEALRDLLSICKRNQQNKAQIFKAGIVPLLSKFMEYKDRDIRCLVLKLLYRLADNDGRNTEIIGKSVEISTIIKMLSSSHQNIRNASLQLLLGLSEAASLCEKIGSVTGGLLTLLTVKYSQSIDSSISGKVDQILKNLESNPANIRCMAEYGHVEPLLSHLVEGSEGTKIEMASYLGEIVLGDGTQAVVAKKASPILVNMVHSENSTSRKAAFKALIQISSYQSTGTILTESGTAQAMAEELFTGTFSDEQMNSKMEAASILANILESGIELENWQVNTNGSTMNSDYWVYNIISLLNSSAPDEFNLSLIRILLRLKTSPRLMDAIVFRVTDSEAGYTLIEFINNRNEELGISAIKLLISLCPYIGQSLAERLGKTSGELGNLTRNLTRDMQVSEEQALSAKFLAKLPHQNLNLNLALVSKNVVPTILQTINQIQRNETRTSKYSSAHLEGLVGVIVRFTATLYDPQILFLARINNFTLFFTELLMKTSSDEVQKLAATGLGNLSSASISLSKLPEPSKGSGKKLPYLYKILSLGSSKRSKMKSKIPVCPVHRGACSSQNTFCLIDAHAVERLLDSLNNENEEVIEASLSALCTLLDEKLDVEESVNILFSHNAMNYVLNVVKEHKHEALQQKSFWVIERFLEKGGDKSVSDISQDRLFPTTLISAFHHGDDNTRKMAERIMRLMNMMPKSSAIDYTF